MRRGMAWISAALLVAAALVASSLGGYLPERMGLPDLQRLYGAAMRNGDQPPVVLIHGVFGAKLRAHDGNERWPGGWRGLLWPSFDPLALPIDAQTLRAGDDGMRPYALFDHAFGRDFYGAIIATLERAGGYVRGTPGQPPLNHGRQYYVFLYDWRRDDVESARALDALIERIRTDYRQPDLRVDIIAHSNGGLIARYYARYGRDGSSDHDSPVTEAGAAKIRRLILLGTPNYGAVSAVTALTEGARVGISRVPPEVLMTLPSTYQLLPHAPDRWLVDDRAQPLRRDVFDVATWRDFRWSIFDPVIRARIRKQSPDPASAERKLALLERYFAQNLDRARRFTHALSVAEPDSAIRPIVLGGDCAMTPARLLVEDVDGHATPRAWPDDIGHVLPGVDYAATMLEPGDGVVTKASLLARETLDPYMARDPDSHFPLDYPVFLCERHDRLASNASFQDNLLQALLSVDR